MTTMLTKRQLLRDLVETTILYELAPRSTVDEIADWYTYAIDAHIVAYEYDQDGLVGFLDWVRIPRVPVSLNDARRLFRESPGGAIIVVGNAYIREDGPRSLLRELSTRIRRANPDAKIACWHNKATDKMVYRRLTKKEALLCEEIAV